MQAPRDHPRRTTHLHGARCGTDRGATVLPGQVRESGRPTRLWSRLRPVPRPRTDLDSALPEFSLVEGGPLHGLMRRVRIGGRPIGPVGFGVALALLTWLPLLCLVVLERVGPGPGQPGSFFASINNHVRFLVAIPLMFLAEVWIDPRLRHFVQDLVGAGVVTDAETPALARAVRLTHRLRDSAAAELGLAILALTLVQLDVRPFTEVGDVGSWRSTGEWGHARLTLAGWWYGLVALPAYQFLMGRWGWRLLAWVVFLWRLSRVRLDLMPTHPDLSGGLGYLPVAQGHFEILCTVFSAVVAGIYAERMLFAGIRLEALTLPLLTLVAANLALFLGPLFFFGPRLLAVKRRGQREYGVLATAYVREFDAKWNRARTPAGEPLLGSPDIQSLNDLAGSFEVIRRMRVVPFGPGLVLILVAATLAPMAPLLLLAFPMVTLLELATKLILGL